MRVAVSKVFSAAVTLMICAAIVVAPSIRPASTQSPAVTTTAVQLDATVLSLVEHIVIPPSLGAPLPSPQFAPIVSTTSIGGTIKNVYNSIEPWVRYGFELAAYAVGWVPYVGWLSPQIIIFYNFGERIVRSITFNIADWLDGNVSFGQGLVNVGVDTVNSFIQLGIDQLNFWLPPLPPLPPLPLTAKVTAAVTAPVSAAAVVGSHNVVSASAVVHGATQTHPVSQGGQPRLGHHGTDAKSQGAPRNGGRVLPTGHPGLAGARH
jgi:hypothetical protein